MKTYRVLTGLVLSLFQVNIALEAQINNELRGINDLGFSTGQTEGQAFIWNGNQVQKLGTLGGGSSIGYSINNNMQVVGSSLNSQGQLRPILYQNGTMTELPTLGGNAEAFAINNVGQIVGYSYLPNSSSFHAVLWENGNILDLGTLGGSTSYAFDINDSGVIVGTTHVADESAHGFLWNQGVRTDLGTFGGGGDAYALSINNFGKIVGYDRVVGEDDKQSFLLDSGQYIHLGTGFARGINDLGDIVISLPRQGGVVIVNGDTRTTINDLTEAWAINNSGQVAGVFGGSPRIVTVPEPSVIALTILSGFLILLLRFRRR